MRIEIVLTGVPADVAVDYVVMEDGEGNEIPIEWFETQYTSEDGRYTAEMRSVGIIGNDGTSLMSDNSVLQNLAVHAKQAVIGLSYVGEALMDPIDTSKVGISLSFSGEKEVLFDGTARKVFAELNDGWKAMRRE